MKYLIFLLLIFSTLIGDDYKHHSKHHINKELSHLELSKEQNRQIKKILKEFRHDLKEFREYKEDIEEQREEIFLKNEFDTKELDKLNSALDTMSHEIENKLLTKIHVILSKKQRKKFIDYFDDWEVK